VATPPPSAFASEAYLDPATGRFTEPHPGVAVRWASPRAEELAKREDASLRETAGRTAAGGYAVELGDRFESRLVATVGEGGEVKLDCEPASTTAKAAPDSAPAGLGATEPGAKVAAPAREER
jgi:hypothetical protein